MIVVKRIDEFRNVPHHRFGRGGPPATVAAWRRGDGVVRPVVAQRPQPRRPV